MNIIYFDYKPIKVKVAITSDEQSSGLMFVSKAEPMAFPFNRSAVRSFWMKDTIVPLDIIFSFKGIVTAVLKGEPLSTKHIGPNTITDLVVELPYGLAADAGAYVGAKVKLCYDVATLARKFSAKLAEVEQSGFLLR